MKYLVFVAFILSGMSALIYQVVWFKSLSYFLGNSTYSQSIVLATYMGGLAIGAWYWGRKIDKAKNPLKIFAFLEIGIAVYCFFYKEIFLGLENLFLSVVSSYSWSSDDNRILIFKFIVSSLSMIIPTILMGGTLPALVKFTSSRIEDVGRNVTLLYFLNSLGAVIGTALAGFYLVESLGLSISTYVAAVIELAIGVYCFSIARRVKDSITAERQEPFEEKISIDPTSFTRSIPYKLLISIAFISGIGTMLFEVVWLRLLVPILSSSTFSYSVILSTFIAGITIGSIVVNRFLNKIKNPLNILLFSLFGVVTSMLLLLPIYQYIPYFLWQIFGNLSMGLNDYSYYLFYQFMFSALIILPPTIFMGITLPLVNILAVNNLNETASKVGTIFSINTLGTVIGSLATGLLLIPLIGISITLYIGIAIYFFTGIFILYKLGSFDVKTIAKYLMPSVLGIIVFLISGGTSNWSNAIMTSEVPRKINRSLAPETFDAFLTSDKKDEKILLYKEGLSGTIVVAQSENEVYLFTNGKGDANSVGDLPTQVSLAQVPMIVHPKPENVFVIGYGAGTTIGNVLTHKTVKKAFVAEISPEVLHASRFFERINQKPLQDKRLTVIKDDGVSALRLSQEKFDLIISQPSNPWSAGVGNLFTSEFFDHCKSKLKKGGIVAQWFSLYETSDDNLKLILRTVLAEFKYVELWQIGASDILMLCSEDNFIYDHNQMRDRCYEKKQILRSIDIQSYPVFLSQQVCNDRKILEQYAGDGPINTEDHPLLEYQAPKSYFYNEKPKEFLKIDLRSNEIKQKSLLLGRYQLTNGLTKKETFDLSRFHYYYGNQNLSNQYRKQSPEVILELAKFELSQKNTQAALKLLEEGKNLDPENGDFFMSKAYILDSLGNTSAAILELDAFLNNHINNKELFYERGALHMKLQNNAFAKNDFQRSIVTNPNKVEAYNNLATILAQEGMHFQAIDILNKGLSIDPNDPKLLFNRGITFGYLQKFDLCLKDLNRVVELDKTNAQAFYLKGKANVQLGNTNVACEDWKKAYSLGFVKANEMLTKFCN